MSLSRKEESRGIKSLGLVACGLGLAVASGLFGAAAEGSNAHAVQLAKVLPVDPNVLILLGAGLLLTMIFVIPASLRTR